MNTLNQNKVSGISGIIIQYLSESGKALDAETLWLELRRIGHSMSVCSIYINVKKLARNNQLYKSQGDDKKHIYSVNPFLSEQSNENSCTISHIALEY